MSTNQEDDASTSLRRQHQARAGGHWRPLGEKLHSLGARGDARNWDEGAGARMIKEEASALG